jgi:hypothetical protein
MVSILTTTIETERRFPADFNFVRLHICYSHGDVIDHPYAGAQEKVSHEDLAKSALLMVT